jgi:predicted DNA-binding transcriptional regulator YafY
MNRTERLYALVEELRARAPRTMRAAELAARFAVSTRIIERDLLALQEAGVPIWAQPGPGGGYGLDVDTTLPPLNQTPDEAVALATALAAMPDGLSAISYQLIASRRDGKSASWRLEAGQVPIADSR